MSNNLLKRLRSCQSSTHLTLPESSVFSLPCAAVSSWNQATPPWHVRSSKPPGVGSDTELGENTNVSARAQNRHCSRNRSSGRNVFNRSTQHDRKPSMPWTPQSYNNHRRRFGPAPLHPSSNIKKPQKWETKAYGRKLLFWKAHLT